MSTARIQPRSFSLSGGRPAAPTAGGTVRLVLASACPAHTVSHHERVDGGRVQQRYRVGAGRPVELAVTLVHEFQHIKLGGLLHLAPLHDREPTRRLYAPWRDDPRPLGGLLQGVYAFTGVTDFWRAVRGSRPAAPATWHSSSSPGGGRRSGRPCGSCSSCGSSRISGTGCSPGSSPRRAIGWTSRCQRSWRRPPMPPSPITGREGRSITCAGTRAASPSWPPAYTAGVHPPAVDSPESTVETDMTARGLDTLAVLTRWRLADPSGFRRPAARSGRSRCARRVCPHRSGKQAETGHNPPPSRT